MGVDIATNRCRIGGYYCKAVYKSKIKSEISSDNCGCETYKHLNESDTLLRVTSNDINELKTAMMQLKSIG